MKLFYEQVDYPVMTITISSGISADGCDIEITDGNRVLFKDSYRYGYNASYDRELAHYAHQDFLNARKYNWENKPVDKPYIGDIILDLCKEYNISKDNIVFKKGKNVFAGRDVSYGDAIEFINWNLPLLTKGAKGVTESYKRLYEQDVEIEVKHEGILEVPEGKNVDDLPISHFEKLAKKKGLGKITKALNNLQVWNKNDDPKLSKWAGDMIDKLNKKFDKKESLLRLNEKDNFNGSITSAADYYYPRWKSEVMDSSQIRDELVRKFGHSEDFADEVLELIFDKYDDDQRYWDEYDESLLRKRKIQKVKNGNKSKTFNESIFDYLDERTWSIVDELERRGYRSGKPIRFGGKLLVDYTKVYETDKRTMSGVEITIDPLEGDVKVQEFSEGIDTEDLTDLCPVDFVETSTDVQKIDNWAKRIKKHSYV